MQSMTPKEIVKELDKYIVGQDDAKRAVAVAVRNRWRRQQLSVDMRDDVIPKNILMIGPTGVGKTEIARRLAKLVNAPFVKVEAVKFTEVGYIGKDVESMVRDLVELAVKMVQKAEQKNVKQRATTLAEDRLLDLLVPAPRPQPATDIWTSIPGEGITVPDAPDDASAETTDDTRGKMKELLQAGKLEERQIELEVTSLNTPVVEVVGAQGLEEMGMNLREMFGSLMPKNKKRRKMTVAEAREQLIAEESQKLIDMDSVTKKAVELTEQNGIIFLDEIDKIAARDSGGKNADVSREGVQRDILPIVEGSSVNTKYGMVKTDHVLFIAAGAFHVSKPSDLMPELQGRFPIRVELNSLTQEDFLTILKEPKNSLTRQYQALLETEGIELHFAAESLTEIANFSATVNERTENIGARRLHTIMEHILEDISYHAPDKKGERIEITPEYIRERLEEVVADQDLSRYIL